MTALKRITKTILVCLLIIGLLGVPTVAFAEGEPADPLTDGQPIQGNDPANPDDPDDLLQNDPNFNSDGLGQSTGLNAPVVAQNELVMPLMLTDAVGDMLSAISALGGADETFELSDAFVTDFNGRSATVSLPALAAGQTVTIDGQNKTLGAIGAKHFTIAANNAGTYVFKDLVLNGNGGNGGISVNGAVEIRNCLIQNNSGTALTLGTLAVTLTIRDSSFINNVNGNDGGAIYSGWGALDQKIDIKNTYFKGNSTTTGRGGAICIPASGRTQLIIDQCVFEENSAPAAGDRCDAGAIAIVNTYSNHISPGTTFSITNTTFANNSCGDDGSALLIEGHTANTVAGFSVSGRIENCTFVGNVANGATSAPGGAVSMYGRAKLELINNTFYDNIKYGNSSTGAAVGLSAYWQSPNAIPVLSYMNNLFVANLSPNVSSATADTANVAAAWFLNTLGELDSRGGNVLRAATATEKVFGTATPALADNGCATKAGYSADGADNTYRTTVQSLLISPRMDTSEPDCAAGAGLANCATSEFFMPAADKRGQTRSGTLDTGSVDVKSAFFNANGGAWDTSSHAGYSYATPVLFNTTETAAGVVAPLNSSTVAAPYTAQLSHTDTTLELIGWHTDDTATTALYAVDATNIPADGTTYYAVWAPVRATTTYTVTFNSQGGSAIGPITNVADGATIGFPGTPTRSGYTFEGWYKEAACVNAWDFSFDTVDRDITLYAKWKADAKVTPETPATSMPSTGDTLNLPLFIVLAAAALAILGAGIALKKRKTQ